MIRKARRSHGLEPGENEDLDFNLNSLMVIDRFMAIKTLVSDLKLPLGFEVALHIFDSISLICWFPIYSFFFF